MTSLPLASAAEAAPVDAAALVEAAVEVEEELPPQAERASESDMAAAACGQGCGSSCCANNGQKATARNLFHGIVPPVEI